MSPEHCLGQELDVRSDIYSFGCVMYEVLAGRAPLSGKNVLATIANQVSAEPMPPRDYNSAIPESLQNVVMRCLSKEPLHRYQTVSDLLDDLQRVKVGQMVEAPGAIVRPKRSEVNRALGVPGEKNSLLIGFSVFVAVIFVCEIVGAFFILKRAQPNSMSPSLLVLPLASHLVSPLSSHNDVDSVLKAPSIHDSESKNSDKILNQDKAHVIEALSKTSKDKVVKVKVDKPKSSGWDELRNLREYK